MRRRRFGAILGIVKPQKQPIPETVDREQFTAAIRKLIAAKPITKASIPRKRAARTAKSENNTNERE